MSSQAWKKEHTIIFSVRLQKSTDADIIEWLNACGNARNGEIKRLMRVAIAAEKEGGSIEKD